jgi:hypothetical protein
VHFSALSVGAVAFREFGDEVVISRRGQQARQSSCEMMAFELLPDFTVPGQCTINGTGIPPSQVVPFSPWKGVTPPTGQDTFSAPLSVLSITIVLSSIPSSSSWSSSMLTYQKI